MTRPVWPGQPGAGCRRFGSACDGGPRRSGWSRATSATERRRSVAGRRSTHGSAAARARDRAAAQFRAVCSARSPRYVATAPACVPSAHALAVVLECAPPAHRKPSRGARGGRLTRLGLRSSCAAGASFPVAPDLGTGSLARRRAAQACSLGARSGPCGRTRGCPRSSDFAGGSRGVFGTRPALERCGTVLTFDSELAWLFRRQRRVLARRSASHAGGG